MRNAVQQVFQFMWETSEDDHDDTLFLQLTQKECALLAASLVGLSRDSVMYMPGQVLLDRIGTAIEAQKKV